MTMKLIVKNEDTNRTATATVSTEHGRATEIPPGESREFWIHSGADLIVKEVQAEAPKDSK